MMNLASAASLLASDDAPSPTAPKVPSKKRKALPPDERIRKTRFPWKGRCEDLLLDWLTTEGNYSRWRSTSTFSGQKGQKRITGDSKRQIAAEVAELLQIAGYPSADAKSVHNKIELLESTYKHARACANGTGFGITDGDIAKSIITVEQKMVVLCPHYQKLDSIFGDRPVMNPPYTAGTVHDLAEASAILFGSKKDSEENVLDPPGSNEEAEVTVLSATESSRVEHPRYKWFAATLCQIF